GLRCESDYVQRAGEVRVSGGVAGWNHASYGIVALGDFRICGGVLNVQAGPASGESGKSLGIYQPSISSHFDITGGRIGLRAAEDSTMSTVAHLSGFVDITGGEFVAGNETENTVCGYAVADGYKVQKQDLDEEGNTALYPYTVVKEPRQEEDQEPRQEEEQEPVKDAEDAKAPVSMDMPKEEAPKEKEPKQEPLPAVNSRLKDIKSKAVYKVVAAKKNGDKNLLEVMYVAPTKENKKATSHSIPEAVVLENGMQATVVSIGKNALQNNTYVKKIVIGKNVTIIGTGAFQNCKKLKNISLGKKLSRIGKNAFKGIYKKATVKVPKKQFSKYKKLLKKAGLPKKAIIKK
ncbi:MAG: leucine-rich repeat domain-containing protein, partial [Lachnospiraceae bacterium]|nr:leucine-rich repeat domain-containing protein [Lachnospiraceae bacterium]